MRRHEALRTTFPVVSGRAVQEIAPPGPRRFPVVDLRALPEGPRRAEADRLTLAEARRPFDLAAGPLLRTTLLRLEPAEALLLANVHHSVADGWSVGVLYRELADLYRSFAAGNPPSLPPLPVQYADFTLWQREWLRDEVLDGELAWWRSRLAGLEVTELPPDRPRPPLQSFRGAMLRRTLPHQALRAFSRRPGAPGATLFMTLLAAFQALLSRWSGRTDVVVGSPIANRDRLELEPLIGFFVNTLVLRTDLAGRPSFAAAVARARETALGAYAHQAVPFERLVEELEPRRDLGRQPLFQILFQLQDTPPARTAAGDLVLERRDVDWGTTIFDLSLDLVEIPGGLRMAARYATDLFDEPTILRLLSGFSALLDGAVREPGRPLADLPLLAAGERHQLLVEWNDTAVARPAVPTFVDLIEARAAARPGAVALVSDDADGLELTWAELTRRANRLAHTLRGLGVGPEVVVGLCAERSSEMVVGLLGILKAGGAYLPLDPGSPPSRLAALVDEARAPVVLAQEPLRARLPAGAVRIITLGEEAWAAGSAADPPRASDPRQLAYVIFTSGSTGRPKGAMNTLGGVTNRLLWMQEEYGLGLDDRVLQKTPFGFDVSVWEFFWPLLAGARLVVAAPGAHRDPSGLVEAIVRHGVTTVHFVPSMLRAFLAFLDSSGAERCASLRRVIASGEALPPELRSRFHRRLAAELHNLYGPTEAAVDVTFWACERQPARDAVPIGRPVDNTAIHLLDPEGMPVPAGVAGELCIGGVQLARGYLGRPDSTAGRFVPDPFSEEPGARLYRTGDLARRRPDGALEFLGRLDHR